MEIVRSKEIQMGFGTVGMAPLTLEGKVGFLIHRIPKELAKPIGEFSDIAKIFDQNEPFFPDENPQVHCYFSFPNIESIDNMIDGLHDVKKFAAEHPEVFSCRPAIMLDPKGA